MSAQEDRRADGKTRGERRPGNVEGQKMARQQGAAGTADQGGAPARNMGLDQPGGPLPENRGPAHAQRKLRQDAPEPEGPEGDQPAR